MLRLIRPFHKHADVVGLDLGADGEFDTDLAEVEVSDLSDGLCYASPTERSRTNAALSATR
ncbi:MAG: hypothetical protein U0984_16065 [Prosthecobacter sp.]|nr:hypothetical protein [Prosthecobacter sp.]